MAKRHLAACWRCRARHEKLERAALAVVAYHESHVAPNLPSQPRERFIEKLQSVFEETAPHPEWTIRRSKTFRPELPHMSSMLVTGIALACASIVCIFLWIHQRVPVITSNALLVRAEAWDSAGAEASTGVVYQKVSITTPQQALERSIYRDVEGKRRPKQVKLTSSEEQLKSRLAFAGLNWDEPLSATGYQEWHDHQRVREDQITRTGKHLLRLTTTTPDGAVASQSLTVRDSDFHPVSRTVTFRDSEPVEIAELAYRLLPWSVMNAEEFEPALRIVADTLVSTDAPPPHFSLPVTVTSAQLDEAELGARLILNQLHADTDEQIQIEREPQGIEIKGLVETERRRRELQTQLRTLPHTTVSILSIEDLKNRPGSEPEVTSLKMGSVSGQPSPLETYFVAHGRSTDTLSSFSHRLLSSALTVSQESKALADLMSRFSPEKERLNTIAAATLTELIFSHRAKLTQALDEEQHLLSEAGASRPRDGMPPAVPLQTDALTALAARNLTLCKELTLGNGVSARSAEAIFPELAASVNELRADARRVQVNAQNNALNGRK